MWFTYFHIEEDLTTAINRYATEVKRICGVIDSALRKQRKILNTSSSLPVWLVGDQYTYADLSFVPWNALLLTRAFPEGEVDFEHEFPEFYKWHGHLVGLPAVKKTLDFQTECLRTMKDTTNEARNRQSDARKL
jgi:glutathione S-transferase